MAFLETTLTLWPGAENPLTLKEIRPCLDTFNKEQSYRILKLKEKKILHVLKN